MTRIVFLTPLAALLISLICCDDNPREQDLTIAIIDGVPANESELKLRG